MSWGECDGDMRMRPAESYDEIVERLAVEHFTAQEVARLSGVPRDIVAYQAHSAALGTGKRAIDILRAWFTDLEAGT